MMFIAKPAQKAAARSVDFMFVVIEASQRQENKIVVVADDTFSHRFDGLQLRQFARR